MKDKTVVLSVCDGKINVSRRDKDGEYDAMDFSFGEFGSFMFLTFIWSWWREQ